MIGVLGGCLGAACSMAVVGGTGPPNEERDFLRGSSLSTGFLSDRGLVGNNDWIG